MLVHAEADRLVKGFSLDPYVCQRAKLSSNVTMILVAMASAVALSACADEGRMTPVYDPVTRDLIRLDYDVNSDGRVARPASSRPARILYWVWKYASGSVYAMYGSLMFVSAVCSSSMSRRASARNIGMVV